MPAVAEPTGPVIRHTIGWSCGSTAVTSLREAREAQAVYIQRLANVTRIITYLELHGTRYTGRDEESGE